MKANVQSFEKQLRKDLAAELEQIYGGMHGEFSTEDVYEKVRALLAERDASAYADIFARSIVEQEDRSRRAIPIPESLDLFDDGILESCVIAIGDGRRVKLGDATLQHLEAKYQAQIENIEKATAAADKLRRNIDEMRPLMASTHGMTVSEYLSIVGVTAKAA